MNKTYAVDIFEAEVVITNDPNDMDITEELNCARTRLTADNKLWNVRIYLPHKCLRTACHESVHGAYLLLDAVDIHTDVSNQEIVAWTTDFIFSKCVDFFHVKNNGQRKGAQQ